jgi:hypothetical protein
MENPFATSPISRNQSNANADSDVEVDMLFEFWGDDTTVVPVIPSEVQLSTSYVRGGRV